MIRVAVGVALFQTPKVSGQLDLIHVLQPVMCIKYCCYASSDSISPFQFLLSEEASPLTSPWPYTLIGQAAAS